MDEDWDFYIAEAQRRVDYQISQQEAYQRQAALILRISIATLGVIIALGRPLNIVSFLETSYSMIDFDQIIISLSGTNAVDTLSTAFAEVVVLLVIFGTGAMAAVSLIEISVQIPLNAYRAAYPTLFQPSIGTGISSDPNELVGQSKACIVSEYQDVILENQSKIESTKEALQSSFYGARNGVLSFFALLVSVIVLILGEGLLQISVLGLHFVVIMLVLQHRIPKDQRRKILQPRIATEGGILVGIVLFSLSMNIQSFEGLLLMLGVFSTAIVPVYGYYRNGESEIFFSLIRLMALLIFVGGLVKIHDEYIQQASELLGLFLIGVVLTLVILIAVNFAIGSLIAIRIFSTSIWTTLNNFWKAIRTGES